MDDDTRIEADSHRTTVDVPDYELFSDLYPRLRRWAAAVRPPHVDADDLVQDALVRILTSGGLGRLHSPQAYLYKTVLSIAADRRRSWSVRYRRARSLASGPVHDSYPSDVDFLLSLDPRERAAMFLRYVEGENYEYIAELLGVSASAARKRVERGRKRLRTALADSTYERS